VCQPPKKNSDFRWHLNAPKALPGSLILLHLRRSRAIIKPRLSLLLGSCQSSVAGSNQKYTFLLEMPSPEIIPAAMTQRDIFDYFNICRKKKLLQLLYIPFRQNLADIVTYQ
jgi:hypothetical protein